MKDFETAERRRLVGVVSVGAVLLSAAGLAYLGAVSYREDRGLVASAVAEQREVAAAAAAALDVEVRAALEAAATALGASDGPLTGAEIESLKASSPLASQPFRIGARGELWLPGLVTLARRTDPVLDLIESRPRPTGERAAMLYRARLAERGTCSQDPPECRASPSDRALARRLYLRLEKGRDTGPSALLGLARLAQEGRDLRAAQQHYQVLRDRFGQDRDSDGIPYALWAELAESRLSQEPAPLLATLEAVVERRYAAPEDFLAEAVRDLRTRLATMELGKPERSRLESLSERLDRTGAARAFYADLASISRSATATPKGQARGQRTLVYRRTNEREVAGIELSPALFVPVADALSAKLLSRGEKRNWGARLVVHRLGRTVKTSEPHRTLASTGFGSLLPNLAVSLVQPERLSDPLDEIVRRRSRRHLIFSGALGLVLLFGLIATIRTAARQRDLAKLKSDFVSTVSHELKTPLTSIRMFGEMLQQGVAGSDRDREQHYQDIIVKESERLGLLIANLLDYSQIEKGARRYALAEVDLRDIAKTSISTFRRLAEGEGRAIELEVTKGTAGNFMVRADREVLVQSMLNLLGNAAKYSKHDSQISVKVRGGTTNVEVAVIDRGAGIQSGEHERIFAEFYRTEGARRSGVEGTGLGLALVRRHVKALSGQISVESEPGHGSTFTISLPRSRALGPKEERS